MVPEAWREMGLSDGEYRRIKAILGREPNYLETGLFAVMWSEHCSYKHSKVVLREFPTDGPWVLQGPGENAGVLDIGDGMAVVFKMESHNHPSAIEPFQGAATGVGGIVRDIFTMGARPIALLNSLRFGDLREARNRYLFSGVVSGISWYGNCIGVPTVGGEVYFDPSYSANPLVNVMCLGLLEGGQLIRGRASGLDRPVMVVGARTGRDGIHGATFASEELNEQSESRRPAVQAGDPFREKLLIEACLEVIDQGLIAGMQDMGAAGLTSSACEMASRAGTGIELDVALVPRREEGMTPFEVMLSESQERMLVVPLPGCEAEVEAVFHKWGLDVVTVGRVTGDGQLRVLDNGSVVADVPARALADEAPVCHPEESRPEYLDEAQRLDPSSLDPVSDWGTVLLKVLAAPTIASKEWVYRQYDQMVRLNTVERPGGGAAILRVKGSSKGLALTTDGNGRYCYLDPYTGGAIAVAEAARNLVAVGARPLGLTDCLNFGNPEKPGVFWQFHRVVEGMTAACQCLGIPVVGGNVSFYNETEGQAIIPTPVVGMVGLLPDLGCRVGPDFCCEGAAVVLVGETLPELGGSEFLQVVYSRAAGWPPELDLERERAVQDFCLEAIRCRLIKSCQDLSEGGLAVALAESCLAGGLGAAVDLHFMDDLGLTVSQALFSESQSRFLLSVGSGELGELELLAGERGIRIAVIGRVGGRRLQVKADGAELFDLGLEELEVNYRGAIPCLLN